MITVTGAKAPKYPSARVRVDIADIVAVHVANGSRKSIGIARDSDNVDGVEHEAARPHIRSMIAASRSIRFNFPTRPYPCHGRWLWPTHYPASFLRLSTAQVRCARRKQDFRFSDTPILSP